MFNTLTEYLFNTQPLHFAQFGWFFLLSIALAFAISIWIKFSKKNIPLIYKKLARKAMRFFAWYGTVSLFLYFLRLERVPYLSMRIWLWAWFLGWIIVAAIILLAEYKKIPVEKERTAKDAKFRRYFEN